VNGRDAIVFVDEGWLAFARANDARHLIGERVLGHSLWEFVSDATTAHLYQKTLRRVRQGHVARFPLRCDGPAHRRWLEMTITPLEAEGAEFATRVVKVEDREAVSLLDPSTPRSEQWQALCAWCSRLEIEGAWVEVEEAIQRLRLFEAATLPRLTHGICSSFFQNVMSTLDDAGHQIHPVPVSRRPRRRSGPKQ
jgi:hypothetical protein